MGLRTFTFGGTSSSSYNMFITEAASYGSPERAVEMLEIPGRNGHFAHDLGRFENTEVTYHVCVYGLTHSAFQTTLTNIRNWLCSKVGYQRLTDDYNPNEYRMAIYKSGIDVSDSYWNGAEFDIVFEVKPQRFLTSGETEITVSDGETITNPTVFDANPLLMIGGYGGITINGRLIQINNATLGVIPISDPTSRAQFLTMPVTIESSKVNSGDTIYLPSVNVRMELTLASGTTDLQCSIVDQTGGSVSINTDCNIIELNSSPTTYQYGTTGQVMNAPFKIAFSYKENGTSKYIERTMPIKATAYANEVIFSYGFIPPSAYSGGMSIAASVQSITADSSLSVLGNPTYIDCDIGEVYIIRNGDIIPINKYIVLGSDLPRLSPGSNLIRLTEDITSLKIVPRWWQV